MRAISLGLALAVIAGLSLLAPIPLSYADRGPRTYAYFIGAGPVCPLAPDACPVISTAENGDTITVTGSGTFSLRPYSATGGGNFIHKDSSGNILGSGTWVASRLLGFHSFGDATPQGLPSNLEGGQLVLQVQLLVDGNPVFTAIMNVDCELGRIPPGQHEGITLAVQRAINFNEKVSGLTVFVRT